VEIKEMMAELYGKATGLCKGRGSSMHIADVKKGMLGANGIVGAGGPLACGSALTTKVLGTDEVTICFFGDGAAEQGTMHESMNLAAIWKLPLVFVCENNMYAVTTPASYHCAVGEICARATAYDIPGVAIDGTDVLAVYETAEEAVLRARRGEGPSLIEARAFRYYGHFMGEPQTYKTKEEIQGYKARDPIQKFKNMILGRSLASETELAKIDSWAEKAVEEAVRFAEASPLPAPEECLTDVYVSYPIKEVEL
jgi:pyruvate dehydrogenase E1 component alpha subunit